MCADGYTGAECDVLDPCADVDCGVGGECEEANTLPDPHLEPVHWTAGYRCVATNDAVYAQSDDSDVTSPIDARVCTDGAGVTYLCRHGGSCDYSSGYGCACTDAWVGEDCATREGKQFLQFSHFKILYCALSNMTLQQNSSQVSH